MTYKGLKGAHASDSSVLPFPALDLDRAEQLDISGASDTQTAAMDSSFVMVFPEGGDIRVSWGQDPDADSGPGSIFVKEGGFLPVIKEREDKISIIGTNGSTSGVVDLVPAVEVNT